jgi:hypothetical protein
MNKYYKLLSCILLCISLFLFISRGTAMKLLVGLPNLNVYTQTQIDNNIAVLPIVGNTIDVQLKSTLNATEIKNFIYMSIQYRTSIYDEKNNILCYNGEEFCSIEQLDVIKNTTIQDNYERCSQNNIDTEIDSYLGNFNTILSKVESTKPIDLSNYKHKILIFMNTDTGKDEIKQDWDYIYNAFNKNPNVLFIRVWTDLNENMGLKKNGKAKFKMKKVKNSKREYEIILRSLPYT